jgi:thiamine phosphate synthase YjbQ (UPF0047 family)
MVYTHRQEVRTRGQGDAHDISEILARAVRDSACSSGVATVFVVGSTAAITTIEFEPGAVADFNRLRSTRTRPRRVPASRALGR